MKKFFLTLSLVVVISFSFSQAHAGKPDTDCGYIKDGTLPNSAQLLPPPPTKDSATLSSDEMVSVNSMMLRGGKRWNLAIQDAELSFPDAAGAFSCALGAPINKTDTPHVFDLLRRSLADAAQSVKAAKINYQRPRPFLLNHVPSCTPDDEDRYLKTDGSYPSGHAAIGWAWALLLAEIAPDREDIILKRGLAFGDSRIICNVHWQSDIVAGRIIGASAVARLHAEKEGSDFRKDLVEAKKELIDAGKSGLKPSKDCAAETEALKLW